MKRIFKYKLGFSREMGIATHEGIEPLCVQMQDMEGSGREWPHLWALVDTDTPMVAMRILCFGTGDECYGEVYLGTVQHKIYVWHFFMHRIDLNDLAS